MKHIQLIILGLILSFSSLSAQHPGRPHPSHHDPEKIVEKMRQELNLREDQVGEVKSLIEEMQAEKMERMKSGDRPSRKEMMEHHAAFELRMNKILDAEQQARFAELKEERKSRKEAFQKPGPEQRAKMKEAHKAVHAYVKDNVMPVVLDKRAELDQVMKSKDRRKVARLHIELAALRAEMMAKKMELKEACESGACKPEECEGPKGKERIKNGMEEFHSRRKEIMQKAEQIASRYETEIASLQEDLKPQTETWRSEIRSILEEKTEGFKPPRKKRHHGPLGHLKKALHSPAGFLLLDPNMEMPDFEAFERPMKEEKVQAEEARFMQVYPNPAASRTSLEYEVMMDGKVSVELLDADGNQLKSLESTILEKGTYTLEVELGDLRSGTVYYFRVTDGAGTEVIRFMKGN